MGARAIVTYKCNKNCQGCCNKNLPCQPEKISLEELLDYDEIIITGGEPLLFPEKLYRLLNDLIFVYNYDGKIILYSSVFDISKFLVCYSVVNGITLTVHNQQDWQDFLKLNDFLLHNSFNGRCKNLRLNLFCDVKTSPVDLRLWDIKLIEWIKNCPLPKNEKLFELKELW